MRAPDPQLIFTGLAIITFMASIYYYVKLWQLHFTQHRWYRTHLQEHHERQAKDPSWIPLFTPTVPPPHWHVAAMGVIVYGVLALALWSLWSVER